MKDLIEDNTYSGTISPSDRSSHFSTQTEMDRVNFTGPSTTTTKGKLSSKADQFTVTGGTRSVTDVEHYKYTPLPNR